MIPTVTGMKLRLPPLTDTRLYRASTNVSKLLLNGSLTPPPTLNPKWFSAAVVPNVEIAPGRYRPPPPITYGVKPDAGSANTAFAVNAGMLMLPPPPWNPNSLYAASKRSPTGEYSGL